MNLPDLGALARDAFSEPVVVVVSALCVVIAGTIAALLGRQQQ